MAYQTNSGFDTDFLWGGAISCSQADGGFRDGGKGISTLSPAAMRLTTLLPAPPMPMTLMVTTFSASLVIAILYTLPVPIWG